MPRLLLLLLTLAAVAPSVTAQDGPVLKPDALLGFRPLDVGGTTAALPNRAVNDIARALDTAVDLSVVASRPAAMGMAYGLVRNGELLASTTSDDLRVTPGPFPIVRPGVGPVRTADPLVGIWGTNGTAFEDPLFGFEDPLFGFEDPLFGYEVPLLAFEDPLFGIWGTGGVAFEDPLFGFEDPLFGLQALWHEASDLVETEYALVLGSYGLERNRHAFLGSAIVVPFDLVDGSAGLTASAAAASATRAPEPTRDLRAWPNPARGAATVTFTLATDDDVRLSVHDALGREVAVLADAPHPAGPYDVRLDGRALPTGTYLVRLLTGAGVQTRSLTLIR